jgi:hypothetical protein
LKKRLKKACTIVSENMVKSDPKIASECAAQNLIGV